MTFRFLPLLLPVAASLPAQTTCGPPFPVSPGGFHALEAAPVAARLWSSMLSGSHVYAGPIANPRRPVFRLAVFSAPGFAAPQPTMAEPAFRALMAQRRIRVWSAPVAKQNDKVLFYAGGEPFYLKLVGVRAALRGGAAVIELSVCRR